MEIAIRNLSELNGPSTLSESTFIGLDAGIYDCDDTGQFSTMYTNHLSWVDTTGCAWSDPSKLGTAGLATISLKSTQILSGIKIQDKGNVAKVYPTIVSNSINIQTNLNEDLKVEVITLLGKKIESIVLKSEDTCIDVSYLKNGLYFVNIYNSKGLLIGSEKILILKD